MTTPRERLRRCPFCSSEGGNMQKRNGEYTTRWFVLCINCGANGPHCESEERARNAWDKRVRTGGVR